MTPKKEYEKHHKELIEIWNNRAEGIFDGRGCPACAVALLKLRGTVYDNKVTCDYCPLPKNVCYKSTSYFNKFNDAKRKSSKEKYAKLIRDAKWMPYEDWIKL